MRSAKKEKTAKTSKLFRMNDVRKKARKERTQKAMRRRSEVAKARSVINGVMWTGAVFAVIVAVFAGNMITIKNPERFYYTTQESVIDYNGERVTETVKHYRKETDFNWEIFFLTFFATFVPVMLASCAANTAVDCAAGVSRDDEGDRMLFEDDRKEKERRAKMEKVTKAQLSIADELQKEEERKATNALLDELTKEDEQSEEDNKA